MSDIQPREAGRFAPKPKPEQPAPARIPTPAHDKMAAMAAKRRANPDGYIVAPPVPLAALNTIGMVRKGEGLVLARRERSSVELTKHLHAWLKQTAEEGLPGDLERAWYAFDPILSAVKLQHRNLYDELYRPCMHEAGQLGLQWERERLLLRAEAGRLHEIEVARKDVADAEQQLAVELPAEIEKRRSRLAELEAAA